MRHESFRILFRRTPTPATSIQLTARVRLSERAYAAPRQYLQRVPRAHIHTHAPRSLHTRAPRSLHTQPPAAYHAPVVGPPRPVSPASSRACCSAFPTSSASEPTSDPTLDPLANVQLPAVGVVSPSTSASASASASVSASASAVWNSPKSPKLSNDASCASSVRRDENVNGSEPLAAAESENGPKPSSCARVR